MISLDNIKKILKEQNVKLTKQRQAIIDALLENGKQFLSAEDVYIKSKDIYPRTNLSTVYRNLELLEEKGIVHKAYLNNSTASYKLLCDDHHHHHMICKSCGKSEVLDYCPVEAIQLNTNGSGFMITDHKMELYGYCKNCIKKKED